MVEKLPHMRVKGVAPLTVIEINDTYILGVYQGTLSEYDLLLRYRQKDSSSKSGWSRIRTPKHIHWAIDAILKMNHNAEETKKFLNFLIYQWDNHLRPLKSDNERNTLLNVESLKNEANLEAAKYPGLANKGEYSIKFLYLMAKLLMVQEKTNLSTAYMFRNLLNTLEEYKDIYKIVYVATHRKR
jgi:hypothetical protein